MFNFELNSIFFSWESASTNWKFEFLVKNYAGCCLQYQISLIFNDFHQISWKFWSLACARLTVNHGHRAEGLETARNSMMLRNEFALNPCTATIILKPEQIMFHFARRSQNCNKRWRSSQKAEPQISETMQNMIPEITSSIMLVSHAKNNKHHKAQLNNCHIQ